MKRWFKSLWALGLLCTVAVAIAAVPGIFTTVNATTGYEVNGSGGTSGYALCSDGTYYDVPCSVSGTGITALTGPVTASGTGSVVSIITPTGVTAASYVLPNFTVNAGGQVTSAANGAVTQNAGLAGSRSIYAIPSGAPSSNPPTASYVYHNTSTAPMIVTVSADYNGGGGFWAAVFCDSSSTPTTVVAQFSRVNDGSGPPDYYPDPVTFVVPAGYYYGISGTSMGTPAALTWTEWIL